MEVLILYGSQTGNSMEIAKSIGADCEKHNIAARVYAMNDFGFAKLAPVKVAIFVASSTGDGDPPENCDRFYSALKRKSHASDLLANLQYTVLGLGDSNYTKYMAVPRTIVTRLSALGGQQFYAPIEVDEVEGIEEKVEPWTEALWSPLKKAIAKAKEAKELEVVVAQGETATLPVLSADTAVESGASELANGAGKKSTVGEGLSEVYKNVPWFPDDQALVGVPALQACRIELVWVDEKGHANGEAKEPVVGLESTGDEADALESVVGYSHDRPFVAPVSDARMLTAPWSDRRVLHVEVDISGSGMQYRPGDSLGILPLNSEVLVDELIERLGLDGGRVFEVKEAGAVAGGGSTTVLGHVKCPCTVKEALLRYVDLTGVAKKGFLRMLLEHTTDPREKRRLQHWSSRGGKEAYRTHVEEARPSVVDLLRMHPSCQPPLAALLDALPPLVARFYSITCAPEEMPEKIQVAFTIVRTKKPWGETFEGVCTTYLERVLGFAGSPPAGGGFPSFAGGVQLRVFVKDGGSFHPPPSTEVPVIMVGPGTGVAPFRSFLQCRRALLAAQSKEGGADAAGGASWLFFGCRREDEDFLYKEELEAFAVDGTLGNLHVAFSRASEEKVYVQHKMKLYGKELVTILKDPQAYLYVCGDGAKMAKDVHAAFVEVLVEHGGLREQMATVHLSNMMNQKRYIRDIWS